MVFISNIVPAFEVDGDIHSEIISALGLESFDNLMFFKLSLIEKKDISKALDSGFQIGYGLKGLQGFNLKQICCMIEENRQM